MSKKMSNAPVYYALAQVQFNPVAMQKYVDDVQDALRREGYTLFETQEVTHLQFTAVAGQAPSEPKVVPMVTWLITKPDRSAGFVLGPSFLTYHTTHYETSDEFIPALLRGLQAVHAVVTLDHVSRMGLRYLDAVLPTTGESVDRYLADGLHGVKFNATPRYTLNESVFDTACGPLISEGTLVTRVHRATSALGFPADIAPNGLRLMARFQSPQEFAHAVIDTDHFVEGMMPLNFEQIGAQLDTLHGAIQQVFVAMTTDHARAVWA